MQQTEWHHAGQCGQAGQASWVAVAECMGGPARTDMEWDGQHNSYEAEDFPVVPHGNVACMGCTVWWPLSCNHFLSARNNCALSLGCMLRLQSDTPLPTSKYTRSSCRLLEVARGLAFHNFHNFQFKYILLQSHGWPIWMGLFSSPLFIAERHVMPGIPCSLDNISPQLSILFSAHRLIEQTI